MPRRPREQLPDGYFHTISRGVGGMYVFREADDARFFLAVLSWTAETFRWQMHAFCLMGTHYHLVLEAGREDLSTGMHRLNGAYAQRFNCRYDRWGHVFGDRFAGRSIESERHLANACRYVVLNPVRAGMCRRARDWPWSGMRGGIRF